MLEKQIANASKGALIGKAAGIGAKIAGKGVNIFFLALSAKAAHKTYTTYTKNDPHSKLVLPLDEEVMKWGKAISWIGREPYRINDISSIEKGGAINELGIKEYIHISETRYPWQNAEKNREYHVDPGKSAYVENPQGDIKLPDPKEAKNMIRAAVGCILATKNELDQDDFEAKKDIIIKQLRSIDQGISKEYKPGLDYKSTQRQLSDIVREMAGIEMDYRIEVGKLEWERTKRRIKYGVIAGGSFVLGSALGKKTP